MKVRLRRVMAFAFVVVMMMQSLPIPVLEIKAEEEVTISNNTHNVEAVSENSATESTNPEVSGELKESIPVTDVEFADKVKMEKLMNAASQGVRTLSENDTVSNEGMNVSQNTAVQDTEKPNVAISVSINLINSAWYINESNYLYVEAGDDETGIEEVYIQPALGESFEQVEEELYRIFIDAKKINSGDTYTIYAKDKADNQNSTTLRIFYDNEAPKATKVDINTSNSFEQGEVNYYFDTIKVSVSAEDNLRMKKLNYLITDWKYSDELTTEEILAQFYDDANLEELDISDGESNSVIKEVDISVSDKPTGRYYIYFAATDLVGNRQEAQLQYAEFAIDKQAPIVHSIADTTNPLKKWYKESDEIILTAEISDELTSAGLSYRYNLVALNNTTDTNTLNNLSNQNGIQQSDFTAISVSQNSQTNPSVEISINSLASSGSYALFVWAKDGCGNVSEPLSYIFHYDTQAPVLSDFTFEVTEKGNKTDASFSSKLGNFFRQNEVEGSRQEVVITFQAKDILTNSFISSVYPQITDLKLWYVTEDEIEESKKFELNVVNENGLPGFTHEVSQFVKDGDIYKVSLEVPVNSVFYRILIGVTDEAGNVGYMVPTKEGKYGSDLVMVDQIKPELSIRISDAFKEPVYIENINGVIKNWYDATKNISFDIEGKDTQSGLFNMEVLLNDKQIYKADFVNQHTTKATTQHAASVALNDGKIESDGSFTFKAVIHDNAGNLERANQTIFVDKDAPVIAKIKFETGETDTLDVVPLQYGFFFKKAAKVTITATDFIKGTQNVGAGVKNITYYLQNAEGTKMKETTLAAQKGKNNTYTASFRIPAGFKGQIYIKATDNVNQSSTYTNPKGTVIESEKEHKKHSYTKIVMAKTAYQDANGNPLYNKMPTIEFKTQDLKSGIAKNVWKVKAALEEKEENQGTLLVDSVYDEKKNRFKSSVSGDTKWEIPNKPDLNLVLKANKKYKVQSEKNAIEAKIKLTDNAGNTNKATKHVFSVDMTAPAVFVEYDNNDVYNGKYYNKERYATIKVVDANFSKEKCEIKATGPGVTLTEWEHTAGSGCNGEIHVKDCEYRCTVGFVNDGDYTFGFECTDLAGWSGSYGQFDEFTIDLTDPVIHVDYDNSDVRNENFYKDARVATVQIEEHNFSSEDVVITMTATDNGNVIGVPEVVGWSQSEDVHTAKIAYDYDGEFTFDIEYKDMADNQAEDYEQDEFVIDITEPEIEFSGVIDYSANKDEVQPVITCSDTNIENVSISLNGISKGALKPEYEISRSGNSLVYEIKDFEHVKDNDDIYTLQVTAMDKAGNEFENELVFSVNRFGSVYQYDAGTKQLLENYYAVACEDLVVQEINVNSLKVNRITYSKDGEIVTLEEGKDYKLLESGDANTWKEYVYTIYGENFTEEGKYILTLYSEDEADNQSDNKAKGKDIEFVIDKTAPSVVLSGVEDNGQYNEESKEFTMNVEDNIGLDGVEVYNDGELIAEFDGEAIFEANGTLRVSLQSKNNWQSIEVITKDMAGNESKSEPIKYLITTNLLVQWYRNKWTFYGSIAAAIMFVGAIAYVILNKKKKE